MSEKNDKIVLCGHYGATNIGDEAIGFSLVNIIKKKYPHTEVVILIYNPARNLNFYK